MYVLTFQDILCLDMAARHVPSTPIKRLGFAGAESLALYTIARTIIVVIVMLWKLKWKTALYPGAFLRVIRILGYCSASKPTSSNQNQCICHWGGGNAWQDRVLCKSPVFSLLS